MEARRLYLERHHIDDTSSTELWEVSNPELGGTLFPNALVTTASYFEPQGPALGDIIDCLTKVLRSHVYFATERKGWTAWKIHYIGAIYEFEKDKVRRAVVTILRNKIEAETTKPEAKE